MLQFYNTLKRKIEPFTEPKKKQTGLYTCGPTVYNYAHIGNLRTYIFEDILKRTLVYNGYKVKHIMNITDVGHLTSDADEGEDKMEKGAAREGKSAWEIAKFYEAAFLNDLKDLNILPADKLPRATDHIKEQIKLVETLEKKGFTYKTSDGVYFDTSKLSNYGKLANLKNQSLNAGSRVEMREKKHPTDFALWKMSHPKGAHLEQAKRVERQMEWLSPWGVGFPGWHLECSAMSVKYLGQPFDIHTGGIDHIPVHHTNEIAQSEAATGKELAKVWMHGEFLVIPGGDKMAKSADNFITLQALKDKGISPLAYRFFALQTHYRKPLTFSWDALEGAQAGLNNLYSEMAKYSGSNLKLSKKNFEKWIEEGQKDKDYSVFKEQLQNAINDDLNLPQALQYLWVHLRILQPSWKITAAKVVEADKILGLKIIEKATEIYEKKLNQDKQFPPEVQKLLDQRKAARAAKNWAKSDELRKELETMGYEVKDTKDGTEVTKK